MNAILQIVLYLLAAIGGVFLMIMIAAAMLAIQISPNDDGCLVIEGRVPAGGSEALDSSQRDTLEEVVKGNL